jgi:glycosyltransferase involved in cell wall biosynthesis
MLRSPDVSFIIPSFRSRETIGATLESIRRQATDLRLEVIVVDSSADETASWIGSTFPEAQVLTSPERLYPGAARNLGAAKAKGESLAFLDADAAASSNWLATLAARLSQGVAGDRVTMVGGAVANGNPERAPSRVLHWIEFSEYLPGLSSGRRATLSSSNLLVGRADFLASGGFSERYRMAEDLLLCRNWGRGVFFEAAAHISHRHRDRWATVLPHLEALGYWSGLLRRNQQTSGAWLRRAPALSLALPLLRATRIAARVPAAIEPKGSGLRRWRRFFFGRWDTGVLASGGV